MRVNPLNLPEKSLAPGTSLFIVLGLLVVVNAALAAKPAVGIYRFTGNRTQQTWTLSVWGDGKATRLILIVDAFQDERLLDEYEGTLTIQSDPALRTTWRRLTSSPTRPSVPARSLLKQTKTGLQILSSAQKPISLKRLTPLEFFSAGMYDDWNKDRDLLFMPESITDGGLIVRRNYRDGSLTLLWFDGHAKAVILPVTNWRFRVGSYVMPPTGERGFDPLLTGDLSGPDGRLWRVRFESVRSPATDASLILVRPDHPDLMMIGYDPLTLWDCKNRAGDVMEAMGPGSNVAIYRWKTRARPEGIFLKPEPDEKQPGRLKALHTDETYIWTGMPFEADENGATLTLPDGTVLQFEERRMK